MMIFFIPVVILVLLVMLIVIVLSTLYIQRTSNYDARLYRTHCAKPRTQYFLAFLVRFLTTVAMICVTSMAYNYGVILYSNTSTAQTTSAATTLSLAIYRGTLSASFWADYVALEFNSRSTVCYLQSLLASASNVMQFLSNFVV